MRNRSRRRVEAWLTLTDVRCEKVHISGTTRCRKRKVLASWFSLSTNFLTFFLFTVVCANLSIAASQWESRIDTNYTGLAEKPIPWQCTALRCPQHATLPLLFFCFCFLDVQKYLFPSRIFFVHWGSQSSVSSLQMMAATEQIRNVNAVGCRLETRDLVASMRVLAFCPIGAS